MDNGRITPPDPDDYFSETRMSFGDHLEELRLHLWKAIAGFLVGLTLGFFVGQPLMRFISAPVEDQLQGYWDRYYAAKSKDVLKEIREGNKSAGSPVDLEIQIQRKDIFPHAATSTRPLDILPHLQPILRGLEMEDWVDPKTMESDNWITVRAKINDPVKFAAQSKRYEIGRQAGLIALSVQESFMVYCKVSIVAGFVIASPWIFFQIWSFIAAGLYPHEKKYVNVFLPVSIVLFLAGVAVCQFLVIPKAIEALLWFNEWLKVEPNFRLNEWLSFALLMPVVFGLSFQTPLVMLFLERIGVLTPEAYRAKRRVAWFLLAVFAAVITPSIDVFSMLYLWVPMCLLYEFGILLCVWSPRQPTFDLDVPESEELIEV